MALFGSTSQHGPSQTMPHTEPMILLQQIKPNTIGITVIELTNRAMQGAQSTGGSDGSHDFNAIFLHRAAVKALGTMVEAFNLITWRRTT